MSTPPQPPALTRVGHLTAAQRGALWRVLSSHALYKETCAQALRGVLTRAQAAPADLDAAAALLLDAPPAYSLPAPWPAPPWPDLIARYGDAAADESLLRAALAEGVTLSGDGDDLDYDMKLDGPERDAALGLAAPSTHDANASPPLTLDQALAWVADAPPDAFTRLSRALLDEPAISAFALRLVDAIAATGHHLSADGAAWTTDPTSEALAESAARWQSVARLDDDAGRALLAQALDLLGSARLGALGVEALYDCGLSIDVEGRVVAAPTAGG